MPEAKTADALAREWIERWNDGTPGSPVEVCDWVVTRDGEIAEIHSFYDATGLR